MGKGNFITFKRGILLVFATVLLGRCGMQSEEPINENPVAEVQLQEHAVYAVLWHQTAAEYKALCLQTYNLARLQLDQRLREHAFPYDLPPAIIMDLDETVLDNSFYNAQLILDNDDYVRSTWKEWSDLANAGAVPGAIGFIKYAKSKNVEVIFISNRLHREVPATKINLEKLGLTDVDTLNFHFKMDESSKQGRRDEVSKEYDVLMLFGDNLADFSSIFDKRSLNDRSEIVDSLSQEFGSHFIILPNVLYGDWAGALMEYDYALDFEAKDSIRKSYLKGY